MPRRKQKSCYTWNSKVDEDQQKCKVGLGKWVDNFQASTFMTVIPAAPPGCVQSNVFEQLAGQRVDARPNSYVHHGQAPAQHKNDDLCDVTKSGNAYQQNFKIGSDKWTCYNSSHISTQSVTSAAPQGCVQGDDPAQRARQALFARATLSDGSAPALDDNHELYHNKDGNAEQQNFMVTSDKWTGSFHTYTKPVTQGCVQCYQSAQHAGETLDHVYHGPDPAHHYKDKIYDEKDEIANRQQNFNSDKRTSSFDTATLPVTPTAPPGCVQGDNSAQSVGPTFDARPNTYVQHGSAPTQRHNDEIYDARSASDETNVPSQNGQENSAQQHKAGRQSGSTTSNENEEKVFIEESETLLRIPGAAVHLIDDEESVFLSQGNFSLSRIMREGSEALIIAKVGEELKWPVVHKGSTVKLDRTHYIFAVEVPINMDDEEIFSHSRAGTKADILNYRLTLPGRFIEEENATIQKLDNLLDLFSTFSAPMIVHKKDLKKRSATMESSQDDPSKMGSEVVGSVDGNIVSYEEVGAALWTEMAPDVNDYDSKLARSVATATGGVIRDIFWLSDSTMVQLDSAHGYMKWRFKPKKQDSKVSPHIIKALRSVAKVTAKTDKVTAGAVEGILYVSDKVTKAVVRSRPGQKVFKTKLGQLYLVSEEANDSIFDAVEKAGKDVMVRSSLVTTDFVNHRYGEAARQLTDESLKSVGHITSLIWSVVKLQKVVTFDTDTSSTTTGA